VGNRKPMADQRAQGRQHVVRAIVQRPGADRRRQLRFVGEAEFGQKACDIRGRVVNQLSLDDPQHIRGDTGVEVDLALR